MNIPLIIDCFMYNGELIVEFRLEYLYNPNTGSGGGSMLLFTYFEILIFLNILLLLFLFHKNILLIKIE